MEGKNQEGFGESESSTLNKAKGAKCAATIKKSPPLKGIPLKRVKREKKERSSPGVEQHSSLL